MQQDITNDVVITNEAANDENMLNAVIAGAEQVLELPKQPVLSEYVLDQMETKRIAWEVGAYRKSNYELYGILAQCLHYSQKLENIEDAKKRTAVLDDFCKTRGYTVTNDTPTATKVIRAVFGKVDRRRTSTYSLVVRAALEKKVKAEDMADWIDKNGGVEEIRLGGKDDQLTPAEQLVEAKKVFVEMQQLSSIHAEGLSLASDADYMGKPCLLVAEYQSGGNYKVKHIVTADSAVNAALMSIYKSKKAAKREEAKKEKLAA